MKAVPLFLILFSFGYALFYPQSPVVNLLWTLTVFFIFMTHKKIFFSLPFYFFLHIILVVMVLLFQFYPRYITIAEFFAPYLLFWFLAIFSFSSSSSLLFLLTFMLNVFLLAIYGNEPVLWFTMVIETHFFYIYLKKREKEAPSVIFILGGLGMFLALAAVLQIFSFHEISQEGFIYFVIWFSIQLPVGLKIKDKQHILLRVFLVGGVLFFWNRQLYENPLFWFFLLLVHYPAPSLHLFSSYSRSGVARIAGVISFLLVLYFHAGPYLQALYVQQIDKPEDNFRVQFNIGRIAGFFSRDYYRYWVQTMREHALTEGNQEYREWALLFQHRFLQLEPCAENYLSAARIATDLNDYERAFDYYQYALLHSFFRKDILKEFLVFLDVHSDFPHARELRADLIRYGFRLYPGEPFFLEQMNRLRKGVMAL